jgi:hypothetical protein
MKTQPWIPVLAWGVLLSGAVGQAWCQPKCAPGVIHRCVPLAELDKSKADGVEAVGKCQPASQQAGWVVDMAPACCESKASGKGVQKCAVNGGVKTAVMCEPNYSIRHSQKNVPCAPAKGSAATEPRKLALPPGSHKRLRACDTPKAAGVWAWNKCDVGKVDARHDTIFGTETIFGDVSLNLLRDKHPCPYEGTSASRPKSLVQAFSKLDASLQKVFVCRRGTCGSPKGKDTCDCQSKSNCKCDMETAPILEGQPEEPGWDGNPFHDDAVEPAPLPPTPRMTSRASNASQVRLVEQPAKLQIVQAKPVSSRSASPASQDDRLTTCEDPATLEPIPERVPFSRPPDSRLTSTQLD